MIIHFSNLHQIYNCQEIKCKILRKGIKMIKKRRIFIMTTENSKIFLELARLSKYNFKEEK